MKLTATTPHGTFTRTSGTEYTFIVVRSCERSREAFNNPTRWAGGVHGRWVKAGGYAVTWHKTEQAARAAASKPYVWADSTVLGIYSVDR